jgi:hypothetical protein
VDAKSHGALTLYCTSRESVPQETVWAAWLYGIHAGWALRHARVRQNLAEVLDSRDLIDPACGLLMQRFRVDRGRALSLMARVSQTRNVKMRELARDLVERAEEEYLAAPPDTNTGPQAVRARDTATELTWT